MNLRDIFGIRRAYLLVALGFVTILFLEGILYQITNNDFLLRFHTETGHYTSTLLGVTRDINYYPNVLLTKNSDHFNLFGYLFYFVLLSILYIILTWKKRAFILLAWLIPVLLYMQYGSMNVYEYVLMHRIWRFLNIITIPSALITAYFLIQNKIPFKKVILVLSIGFLFITSLYYIDKITTYMNGAMLDYRITANYLKDYPDKDIYADPDTIGKLDFLLGYERRENLKNIENIKNPKDIRNSFVVVDASRGYVEVPELRDTLPKFLWNPPPNWNLVQVVNESNIDFYASYDTKIYYVP